MISERTRTVPILMYHSLSRHATDAFRPFIMAPERFAEQMDHLQARGYTALTVSQLAAVRDGHAPLPRKPVVITFDDGFADFAQEAVPVLQRTGMNATLYIPTKHVGKTSAWMQSEGEADRPLLTWEQIVEIDRLGIECGAHSHSHPQLDLLSYDDQRREVTLSKHLLEEHLGHPVASFAYPHGYYSAFTQSLLRVAGFSSACAVKYTMATMASDMFALPRLLVNDTTTLADFDDMLSQPPRTWWEETYAAARVPVWRIVRRIKMLKTPTQSDLGYDPEEIEMLHPITPTRMVEVELSEPLEAISSIDTTTGKQYSTALVVVRLHTIPIGIVEFNLGERGISAEDCSRKIWAELHQQIHDHLSQDWQVLEQLDATGITPPTTPVCIASRQHITEHAPMVSIIIPTHGRPKLLRQCVASLAQLDYPNYEIIIAENAPSSTEIAEWVHQEALTNPNLRYVHEDRLGGYWARNRGLEVARGEIIAFTDDDVLADRHWLTEMVRGFSLADRVGCVTGLVLPMELETPAQVWFEEFNGFNKGFKVRIYQPDKGRTQHPLYPYNAGSFGTGASMAFTAQFLRRIGGFDPALPNGGDIAAFFQVIAEKYQLVYTPGALLYHQHRREYRALRQQIYNYGTGLLAYLVRCLFLYPHLIFDFAARVPYGLYYILSKRSPKNRKKSATYPKELTEIERQGLWHGVSTYLQNRQRTRQLQHHSLSQL